ncbi:DASH complex subunit DAM1 [Erysiphe necator]|uniref:DASH complex subunit DAM1 n=1 Tax=Uncinula necator TaxID=52586 RepID=A0A0B1PE61_UNCNE|nr:DASH complex subunit DAM1 [Erysiphe necator]KHJ34909.1 putative dash complex subunit dam1 [Erysiphe necator]
MYTSSVPLNESNNGKKIDLTNRKILPRPTTPLRSSSRVSFRESGKYSHCATSGATSSILEPAFAELSDSMADLEANFMHLQFMHESLARFNENFSSFLYGLHMNAFCVDFPEAPIPESFLRVPKHSESSLAPDQSHVEPELDTTFMTTDTSFIENPSKSLPKNTSSASNPERSHRGGSVTWGKATGRGGIKGSQASGIARVSKSRGTKG